MMNAIAKIEPRQTVPNYAMCDLERMAVAFARSGMFGAKTPDQALALCLIAQAEGKHPAIAAKTYHIINGTPAKKADAMLSDFQAAGGKVQWHSYTDEKVSGTFSHADGGSVTIDWDQARVVMAGLAGNPNHKKYPRAMKRARCISEGVRTVYPSATSGMYAPEEIQDGGVLVAEREPQQALSGAMLLEQADSKLAQPVHPVPTDDAAAKEDASRDWTDKTLRAIAAAEDRAELAAVQAKRADALSRLRPNMPAMAAEVDAAILERLAAIEEGDAGEPEPA